MKPKRYEILWRNKWITSEAKTIDDFIETYEGLVSLFRMWKEKGIILDDDSGIDDDYATFYTFNKEVAEELQFKKWDQDEWDEDEEDEDEEFEDDDNKEEEEEN